MDKKVLEKLAQKILINHGLKSISEVILVFDVKKLMVEMGNELLKSIKNE
jgi:hypothetical protein